MRKILFIFLFIVLALLGTAFAYFFVGRTERLENVAWGVNFSQKHAANFGLDWKETYTALLDDAGVKKMKIAVHWDTIEPLRGEFSFNDIDFQIQELAKRNGEMVLVIGMKTPRWPECHIPSWAQNLSKKEQQKVILVMIKEVVERYRGSEVLFAWQVENEPFFPFGECLWADEQFLSKEIELVKSLDDRPIIITDSGEGSFWTRAARHGDIVGTTMYRKVWVRQLGFYLTYPFPPVFYDRKAKLIKLLFGKEVIGVELQTEPWGPKLLYDSPLKEQQKTMNLEQFKKNIEFARRTGLKTHYLWGAEWWYWMKEVHGDSAIWNEARTLFAP